MITIHFLRPQLKSQVEYLENMIKTMFFASQKICVLSIMKSIVSDLSSYDSILTWEIVSIVNSIVFYCQGISYFSKFLKINIVSKNKCAFEKYFLFESKMFQNSVQNVYHHIHVIIVYRCIYGKFWNSFRCKFWHAWNDTTTF